MAFMSFIVSTPAKIFTVMHNKIFEHSDTLSFALLARVILYLSDKQFGCSVFTFVQYSMEVVRARIQRGDRGYGPPMNNHKNIGFLSNTGPAPLQNHKNTKPAFTVGPSSARQHNAI